MHSNHKIFHNSFYAMGTRFNLILPDSQPGLAEEIFAEIAKEVRRLDAKLNRFSKDSELYEINVRAARRERVELDSEMTDILILCGNYYYRTNGAFDVTLTALFEKIYFDEINRRVWFAHPDTKIDLGGFAKGYALEKVRDILEKFEIENALVSFGESSILAMGKHPYGHCWKLGIEHCFEPSKNVFVFEANDESLSTSGFKNISAAQGNPFHIINPMTGKQTCRSSTITVKTKSCLDAEVLSTALFACEAEKNFLCNFDCQVVEIDYKNKEVIRINQYGNGQKNLYTKRAV